jgi:hypothetical protein
MVSAFGGVESRAQQKIINQRHDIWSTLPPMDKRGSSPTQRKLATWQSKIVELPFWAAPRFTTSIRMEGAAITVSAIFIVSSSIKIGQISSTF